MIFMIRMWVIVVGLEDFVLKWLKALDPSSRDLDELNILLQVQGMVFDVWGERRIGLNP